MHLRPNQLDLRDHGHLRAMCTRRPTFPVAEGIGIFFGIIAWDLLTSGRVDIVKALLIAVPCSLVWFAVRRWRSKALESETKNDRS